jgi:hypothetical protein
MARLKYYRRPGQIPGDGHGMAKYWKEQYNANPSGSSVGKALRKAKRYYPDEFAGDIERKEKPDVQINKHSMDGFISFNK